MLFFQVLCYLTWRKAWNQSTTHLSFSFFVEKHHRYKLTDKKTRIKTILIKLTSLFWTSCLAQVQVVYASVYLNLDSVHLRGVGGGHLVQLQLKYPSSKSKYTSATPRCTWTWTRGTWAESAKYTSPRCGTYTRIPFLQVMTLANNKYSGKGWNSMGPPLITAYLRWVAVCVQF